MAAQMSESASDVPSRASVMPVEFTKSSDERYMLQRKPAGNAKNTAPNTK